MHWRTYRRLRDEAHAADADADGLLAESMPAPGQACLKLAIPPHEIAKIMMDEAVLALMAESTSLSDIQAEFKRYGKRELSKFYLRLKTLATNQTFN